jgi:hypothetical protein
MNFIEVCKPLLAIFVSLSLVGCEGMAIVQQQKALEASYQSGQISKSSYAKRKKELDQQYAAYNKRLDAEQEYFQNGPQHLLAKQQNQSGAQVAAQTRPQQQAPEFSKSERPSESFCQQSLLAKVSNESRGLFKVVSFKKVNGYSEANHYVVQTELVFTATQNCTWSGVDGMSRQAYSFRALPGVANGPNQQMLNFSLDSQPLRAGQTVKTYVNLTFRNTERGWQLISTSIRL